MICAAVAALASCGDSDRQNAEEMLKQAGYDYEHGRYDMALATIDSLRKTYPDIVDVRRKALALYQNISLKKHKRSSKRPTDSYRRSMLLTR